MRILLLLSALLTALAGSGAPARAAGVPAQQVSTLIAAVAARGAVTTAGRRPVFVTPLIAQVAAAPASAGATVFVSPVPLYAGRLRV